MKINFEIPTNLYIKDDILIYLIAISLGLLSICVLAIIIVRIKNNLTEKRIKRLSYIFQKIIKSKAPTHITDFSKKEMKLINSSSGIFEKFLIKYFSETIKKEDVFKLKKAAENLGIIQKLENIAQKNKKEKRASAMHSLIYLFSYTNYNVFSLKTRKIFRQIVETDTFYPSFFLASISLGVYGDISFFPTIFNRFLGFKRYNRNEIYSIMESFGEKIIPELLKHLEQPESIEVSYVTSIIDFIKIKRFYQAKEIIENIAVSSKSSEIVIHAAETLGFIGDENSLKILEPLTQASDFRTKLKSIISIAQIKKEDAIGLLDGFLGDDNWWIRRNAAESLMRLGLKGKYHLEQIAEQKENIKGKTAAMILAENRFSKTRWRYNFADSFV